VLEADAKETKIAAPATGLPYDLDRPKNRRLIRVAAAGRRQPGEHAAAAGCCLGCPVKESPSPFPEFPRHPSLANSGGNR
jgi:hypothetical protein